jgi:hypothetical protein
MTSVKYATFFNLPKMCSNKKHLELPHPSKFVLLAPATPGGCAGGGGGGVAA